MASAWGKSWGLSWGNAWGLITGADTHDGGDYYYRWWKKQHEKKPQKPELPQLQEVIEAVERTPERALAAVPQASKQFYIDYTGLKTNLEAQRFVAEKILILMEQKRLEDEEEEAIEMLLLAY